MIGNIILPYKAPIPPFDPDKAFDPTTHIATEAAFIQLLENEVYDEKYIGYMVTLSNSTAYDGGVWVIADVNHDSANTGQTDCYDLISRDCFSPGVSFGPSNGQYRSSNIRTWLNGTFYNGFSNNFSTRMLVLKYYYYDRNSSSYSWYSDDKIVEPSGTELGESRSYLANEGAPYSIFTGSTSRIKNQAGGSASSWWTRSIYTSDGSSIWEIDTSGSMGRESYYMQRDVAPIIRVQ